ncbi:MAG: hypothetical protein ACK54H_05045 [Phycisphaerales bacterium]
MTSYPHHDIIARIVGSLDGVLRSDELFDPVRLIIDPDSGFPAAPVRPEVFAAISWSLYLPEDRHDAVQLAVSVREIDPMNHAAADRWAAYYGKPRFARFAVFDLDFCKRLDVVLEGDDVRLRHPFRNVEGALCREFSMRKDELRAACERLSRTPHPAARVVGVDPFGIDVQVSLGVMRLEFDEPVSSADHARAAYAKRLAP